MDEQLIKKLYFKENYKIAVINADFDFVKRISGLTIDIKLENAKTYDAAIVFCKSKTDADTLLLPVVSQLKPDGVFWVTYPKGTSKIKTDINRDKGWDVIKAAGFDTVAAISIDDVWSGLRMRQQDKIKRK